MLNKIQFLGNKSFGQKIYTFIAILGITLFFSLPTKPVLAQYIYTQTNITTTRATNVTSGGAVLNGLINGNNLYSTYNIVSWFEYGPNTDLRYSTNHVGPNTGYANFSANVANLSPSTVYYFRAVTQTPQGIVYGDVNSFRTNYGNVSINGNNDLPAVLTTITNPATSISSTSANLNGVVMNQPNYSSNTWFEYGTPHELGNSTPKLATGVLTSIKHVSTLTKLSPNTTYYFRAVSEDVSGRVNGSVLTFTTDTKSYATTSTSNINNTDNADSITKVDPSLIIKSKDGVASYLGANVLSASAGSFFPGNILGWLIILILVLILVLLVRHPSVGIVKAEPHTTEAHH